MRAGQLEKWILCTPHRTEIPGPCQGGSHCSLILQNLGSEHFPAVITLSDHHFGQSTPGNLKSRTVLQESYINTFLSFYFRKKSDGHGHGPSKLAKQAKSRPSGPTRSGNNLVLQLFWLVACVRGIRVSSVVGLGLDPDPELTGLVAKHRQNALE